MAAPGEPAPQGLASKYTEDKGLKTAERCAAPQENAAAAPETESAEDDGCDSEVPEDAGVETHKNDHAACQSFKENDMMDATSKAAKETGATPSPPPRRKHKPRPADESEGPRPPRLSPEPPGDPEAAKRVREKNRLRLYRFNRNVEKRQALAASEPFPKPHPGKGMESKRAALGKAQHRPSSTGDNEDTDVHSQDATRYNGEGAMEEHHTSHRLPKSPVSAGSAECEVSPKASPLKSRIGMKPPRLSPVPVDADAEEQKRIKSKNRLRTYRWNKAHGLVKKRVSSSGEQVHEVVCNFGQITHRTVS